MTIQMIESDLGEVFHLFKVMNKYNVKASLEMKTEKNLDQLIGIYQSTVDVDYFERSGGPDSLIVKLGDSEFSFDLGVHSFGKEISGGQIFICIASEHYVAWFNSGLVPPEGIKEAYDYQPLEDPDPIPLVEGMNPSNQLDDRSDLDHAIMDICIEVEDGRIPHEEAAFGRISKIIDAYLDKHYGQKA